MSWFCFKSNWLTEYSSYKQLNIQSFIAIFWNVSIDCSISKSLRLLQSTIWNENSRCVRLQIKGTDNFSNKNVETIYSFFVNVTIVQCQTTCCFCYFRSPVSPSLTQNWRTDTTAMSRTLRTPRSGPSRSQDMEQVWIYQPSVWAQLVIKF